VIKFKLLFTEYLYEYMWDSGGAVQARAKTPVSVDRQTAFFSMSFSELANENAFWNPFRG
jgi:hypothetical protein